MGKEQYYWYDANQIEQIAIRLKKNDKNALLEFAKITQKRYYFLALEILNYDEELAHGVVVDTYADIPKKIHQLKEDKALVKWAETILTHKAVDVLRKEGKLTIVVMSELDQDDFKDSFEDSIENERFEYDPESQLNTKEITKGLHEILDTLPTMQRIAVTMYHLENGGKNYTYREVGERLGISEEAARSQVRYASKSIKTKVEKLRAEGKSFFTVAPIPFLAWMLNEEFNKVEVPNTIIETVKAATIAPVKATTTTKAVTKGVKKATVEKTVASTAGSSVAKMVAIGVTTVAVATGAVFGGYTITNNYLNKKENTAQKVDTDAKDEKKETVAKKENKQNHQAYDTILSQYYSYVSGEASPTPFDTGNFDEMLSSFAYNMNLSDVGYAFMDINADGQDELLVGDPSETGEYGRFCDVYTLNDGVPELANVESDGSTQKMLGWYRKVYKLTSDKKIFFRGSSGAVTFSIGLGHMGGDTIIMDEEYNYDGNASPSSTKYNASTDTYDECSNSEIENIIEKYQSESSLTEISYTPLSAFKATASLYDESTHTQKLDGYDATVKIPTMFVFDREGQSPQAPQYDCYYKLDDSKLNGYSGSLTISKSTAKIDSDSYTKTESQNELDENPDSKRGKTFGTEKKYVRITEIPTDGEYPGSISMNIIDLDCDAYTYRVDIYVSSKTDGNGGIDKKTYKKLYDEIVKMAKSVKWN